MEEFIYAPVVYWTYSTSWILLTTLYNILRLRKGEPDFKLRMHALNTGLFTLYVMSPKGTGPSWDRQNILKYILASMFNHTSLVRAATDRLSVEM
jgi:hypothetical protein